MLSRSLSWVPRISALSPRQAAQHGIGHALARPEPDGLARSTAVATAAWGGVSRNMAAPGAEPEQVHQRLGRRAAGLDQPAGALSIWPRRPDGGRRQQRQRRGRAAPSPTAHRGVDRLIQRPVAVQHQGQISSAALRLAEAGESAPLSWLSSFLCLLTTPR